MRVVSDFGLSLQTLGFAKVLVTCPHGPKVYKI